MILDFHTCLQYKVWIKETAEQSFLYGNNVMKSGLARMTEGCPQYQGVVVYSMKDIPLVWKPYPLSVRDFGNSEAYHLYIWPRRVWQGFGATARSTADCRTLDATSLVVFHQADLGEVGAVVLRGNILFALMFRFFIHQPVVSS